MPYKTKAEKAAYDRERYKKRTQPRRTREYRKAELAESATTDVPLPTAAYDLNIKGPAHGLRIAVLPDAQVRKGVPMEHLAAYGEYIAAKRPDVVVCIGDFADMPSLSTWEKPGSLSAEGRRYAEDVESVHRGMELFLNPIAKASGYKPRLILTYGNHEDRVTRAINADPTHLQGVISLDDLKYADYGWETVPFLQPVVIGGVAFCHYFPTGVMGKPVTNPALLIRKLHMSAYAGHQQGRDIAYAKRGDGGDLTAIISGSFYQHDEHYLSPFTNKHWRGAYFLHEVKDGSFDALELSVKYLLRRFGK